MRNYGRNRNQTLINRLGVSTIPEIQFWRKTALGTYASYSVIFYDAIVPEMTRSASPTAAGYPSMVYNAEGVWKWIRNLYENLGIKFFLEIWVLCAMSRVMIFSTEYLPIDQGQCTMIENHRPGLGLEVILWCSESKVGLNRLVHVSGPWK